MRKGVTTEVGSVRPRASIWFTVNSDDPYTQTYSSHCAAAGMPTCRATRGPQNPKVNDVVLFVPVADGAAEHPIIRHQGFHVRSRPDPGADVGGVSPVTVQMWQG